MKEIVGPSYTPIKKISYSPDLENLPKNNKSSNTPSPREHYRQESSIRNIQSRPSIKAPEQEKIKKTTSDNEFMKKNNSRRENTIISKILGKEKENDSDQILKKELIDEINEIPTRDISS